MLYAWLLLTDGIERFSFLSRPSPFLYCTMTEVSLFNGVVNAYKKRLALLHPPPTLRPATVDDPPGFFFSLLSINEPLMDSPCYI